ncbi:hypothetical protein KCU81_g9990, partial [Aureobasidium melanogenum]|uniref:F-box domain-containing protein n=3 Tax=Aureobasidium melanogenum TaxID=46634 RepID=A0A074VIU3_AURM1
MPPELSVRAATAHNHQRTVQKHDTSSQYAHPSTDSLDPRTACKLSALLTHHQAAVVNFDGPSDSPLGDGVRRVTYPRSVSITENSSMPVIDLRGDKISITMCITHSSSHKKLPTTKYSPSLLLGLPNETRFKIFNHKYLSIDDLRSLRLVSHETKELATEVLRRLCFTLLDVLYTTRHDRSTESTRQLTLILASEFGFFIEGVTFDTLGLNRENRLKEEKHKERRKKEEHERRKKNALGGLRGKEDVNYSRLENGRWSDLLSHLYDDLDSIRIPNIKTVYLCQDEDIDHDALEKAPDPELEGRQFIEARCRSMMEESQILVGETASTLIGKEALKKLLINLWAVLRSKLVDLMVLQGASGSQRMYDAIVLQNDPSP